MFCNMSDTADELRRRLRYTQATAFETGNTSDSDVAEVIPKMDVPKPGPSKATKSGRTTTPQVDMQMT